VALAEYQALLVPAVLPVLLAFPVLPDSLN
jgi:hypothetical protein